MEEDTPEGLHPPSEECEKIINRVMENLQTLGGPAEESKE